MSIDTPKNHLYLGTSPENDSPVFYDSANLTTHGVIVGMTGSGKTGLGVVMLEEALLSGIPTLIIDPKGLVAMQQPQHLKRQNCGNPDLPVLVLNRRVFKSCTIPWIFQSTHPARKPVFHSISSVL